jgi:hypothetical protein
MMLTGRTRYRVNWRGKLILQVEYWQQNDYSWRAAPFQVMPYLPWWTDATLAHMQAIERGDIRPLQPEAISRLKRPLPANEPGTWPPPPADIGGIWPPPEATKEPAPDRGRN